MNNALWVRLVTVMAIGIWSAILMNRGIANFHDGLRPVMPEWLSGRMTRRELGTIAFAISLGFVVGGAPLTLATGIVITSLIMLPTDVIGAFAPNWPAAAIGGGLWSALVVLSLQGFYTVVGYLPVNFLAPLSALALPLVFAFTAFPALAVAYQFGVRAGAIAIGLSLIARQLVAKFAIFTLAGNQVAFSPDGAAMLTGVVVLLAYAIGTDRKAKRRPVMAGGEAVAYLDEGPTFASNAIRLRKNIIPLMVQGALLGLATRTLAFGWGAADVAAASNGKLVEAAIVAFALAIGFLPLVGTTALATGVYQAVGMCFVFPVAYLMPHPLIAAVAGAAVFGLEILALGFLGKVLDQYPTVRASADSLRSAMEKVVTVALVAGSMIAADKMMPGGGGYFIVAALVVLNEIAGHKFSTTAAAPMAAIGVGVLANILVLVGIMPKPAP